MDVAVFLDRDGTINEEMGYINHIDRFVLLPGATAAIRRINESGFKAVVITNQSGAARGYFPMELIDQVHQKMEGLLREEGAFLDGIYTCAHGPAEEGSSGNCDCRKPGIALMQQAAEELEIDLQRSYVVGDRFKDIEMARNAGAKAILVLTGYGKGELEFFGANCKVQADFVAEDLGEAVDWILTDARSETAKTKIPKKPQRSQRAQRAQRKANVEMAEIDRLSNKIIGLAIEIHRHLGPGLLESAYQQSLAYEFSKNNIPFELEKKIPVMYKSVNIDCAYRADMVVDNKILLEFKSVDRLLPIHEAQVLTYLKLSGLKLGMLINFNVTLLRRGIRRIIL
jgi:D-glycero-D-manno-heptose 1,7-bisphosphate phosphatase